MSEPSYPDSLLKAEAIDKLAEQRHVHQFNPNAIRHTRSLSDLTGLSRLGLHLVRVEPGDQTTRHHYHHYTDEFVYILQGRGIAQIGETEYEIGAGDFMGFPAQGPAHSMKNPFDDDLLYLMGGNREDFDVVDYPELERRMVIIEGIKQYADWQDIDTV